MSIKLHHTLLAVSISTLFAACGDDGPCLEGGDVCIAGETGEPDEDVPGCAPFTDEDQVGSSFSCQGQGTGWFVTDIHGLSDPATSCLAYDTSPVPSNPTSDDCGWRPLEVITSAFDVPDPAACCSEEAFTEDIVDVCTSDCGFAAVKVAVSAIRASADALEPPEGAPKQPFETSKSDLYAYADYIESPFVTKYIATKVSASPGEVVSVNLGSGVSNPLLFGHIKDATLYLGCELDAAAPYELDTGAGECTEPANIPARGAEQNSEGSIVGGSVAVSGPGVYAVSQVKGATFKFREVLNRDSSIDFILTSFDASLTTTTAGSFKLYNIEVALAAPASASLEGEIVTFAPGTLRFALSASVSIDGEKLFDGAQSTAEYTNHAPARAIRGVDGSFAFIDASFRAGEYTAVLNTEPAPAVRVE